MVSGRAYSAIGISPTQRGGDASHTQLVVTSAAYYLFCLLAAVLASALASGLLVWRLRVREVRALKALELLDALGRYGEWVAAQGAVLCFQAPVREQEPALQELGAVQQRWFPELTPPVQSLFEVHLRLRQLLQAHRRKLLQDPQAGLESDHDAAFMALWREHAAIVQSIERRLTGAVANAAQWPPSTWA